jgi:hypothetical protein
MKVCRIPYLAPRFAPRGVLGSRKISAENGHWVRAAQTARMHAGSEAVPGLQGLSDDPCFVLQTTTRVPFILPFISPPSGTFGSIERRQVR